VFKVSNYIIRRLLMMLPTVTIVAILVFSILHIIPGGPAAMMLGLEATTEEIEELSESMGLNKPLLEQFFIWGADILKGDLGESFFFKRPVLSIIFDRIQVTISLAIMAQLIAVLIAIPLGVISAVKHNTVYDRLFMVIAVSGVSIPGFWLALIFVLIFSVQLRWFPVQGYIAITESFSGWIRHLILPAVALGVRRSAIMSRITRSCILEELSADYIRTIRSKGITEKMVIFKHALKNSMITIITVIGLSFTTLLGGAIIIEMVFCFPGIGSLMIGSIMRRDYPVIQGILIIFTLICVTMNLLIDISYIFFDPKLKYE